MSALGRPVGSLPPGALSRVRWTDKVRKAAVSWVPTDRSNTTPAGTGEAEPRNECTERVSLHRDLSELQAG